MRTVFKSDGNRIFLEGLFVSNDSHMSREVDTNIDVDESIRDICESKIAID